MDEYERKLAEINCRLVNLQGGVQESADLSGSPPLSRRITKRLIPNRFRMPQVHLYDGTTDPLDHLESYKVLMMIQGAPDALLCIAFPVIL